jgi:hypothetical protein
MSLGTDLDLLGLSRYNRDYGTGQDYYNTARGDYGLQMGLAQQAYNQALANQGRQMDTEDAMRDYAYGLAQPWQQGALSTYQKMVEDYNRSSDPATDPLRRQTQIEADRQALRQGLGGGAGSYYTSRLLSEYDMANRDKNRLYGATLANMGNIQYNPNAPTFTNQIQNQGIGLQAALNANPMLGQQLNPTSNRFSVNPTYINDPSLGLRNPTNPMLGQGGLQYTANIGGQFANQANALSNIYMQNGANQGNIWGNAGNSLANTASDYMLMQNLMNRQQPTTAPTMSATDYSRRMQATPITLG